MPERMKELLNSSWILWFMAFLGSFYATTTRRFGSKSMTLMAFAFSSSFGISASYAISTVLVDLTYVKEHTGEAIFPFLLLLLSGGSFKIFGLIFDLIKAFIEKIGNKPTYQQTRRPPSGKDLEP